MWCPESAVKETPSDAEKPSWVSLWQPLQAAALGLVFLPEDLAQPQRSQQAGVVGPLLGWGGFLGTWFFGWKIWGYLECLLK